MVSSRDHDDIADHQLFCGGLRLDAVAPHPRGWFHHRLERVHGALGLSLLAQPNNRVQDSEEHQQHRGAPLADKQRHDRGTAQDQLHVASVLGEEPPPPGLLLLVRQCVRPVLGRQISCAIGRQSDGRVDVQHRRDGFARLRVPNALDRDRHGARFGPRGHGAPPGAQERSRLRPERCDEDRFDGVQPILGLVEHDAGCRLEDLAGDLES